MDEARRLLLMNLALGGAVAGLPLAGAAAAPAVPAANGPASEAWLELAAAMAEIEAKFQAPPFAGRDPAERAEARRYMAATLQTALLFWADTDPARPFFARFVDPHRKLLGDNPDTLYYFAAVQPEGRYVVRGNIAGAAYTSFTIERSAGNAGGSKGLGATLNDTEFDVRADGSYEIAIGGPKQARNWMPLAPDAASITTRHYFEWGHSAAADPHLVIPLSIEPADPLPVPPPPDDASVAENLRRVTRYFRSVFTDLPPVDVMGAIGPFNSKVANQFTDPNSGFSNRSIGYAAADNAYLQAQYALAPDEALVMRGRFPSARFTNVMLFNRYWQTYDYAHRRVSLNRRQTRLEPDGSFRIVVAHADPGTPNWLDASGRPTGTITWRFLLPQGRIEPVRTSVVKLRDVVTA